MDRLLLPVALLAGCASPGEGGGGDGGDGLTFEQPADAGSVADGRLEDGPPGTGLAVGERAPDFTLLDHTGEPVALYEQLGTNVLVVGSSSW